MSAFQFGGHTPAATLCCMCGVTVSPPNPANMCVNCIRSQVDITEGIPKQITIPWCKGCGRYHEPPNRWVTCELESRELLSYCMRRIKGLNKVRLIDANFVWTEPHSKRLKVKLTIQKEVFTSTILQQVFIIEYIISNLFCPECHKGEAGEEHTWVAVVQVTHKKTFFWLEQLILKHQAHANTMSIKEEPDGLDFYFSNQSWAIKFVDFLQVVIPLRYKTAQKLVSHDAKSNIFNYKHTFSVEIPPICKDDLVCLPASVARSMGNISPIVLCWKVSNLFSLLDPFTLQSRELNSNSFWCAPFRAIATKSHLTEFIVLDVEPLGQQQGKLALADVTVARNSDFGRNDKQFFIRSHLGAVLNPGDTVLGYDLSTANINDSDLEGLRGGWNSLPEVVLVRKSYPVRRKKNRDRHWRLQALAKEREEQRKQQQFSDARDYEDFLRDLEEDPEMRQQVQLYKSGAAAPTRGGDQMTDIGDEEEEADFPDVAMEELLDDVNSMQLNDNQGFGNNNNGFMLNNNNGFDGQQQQQQSFGFGN